MGWVCSDDLKQGGDHLLEVLRREGAVPYSRFYHDDVDPAALAAATGLHQDEAHVILEYAAGQLERAGIVSFTPLPGRPIDGEDDYEIRLTERGRIFLAAGKAFRYRDMDL